MNRIQNFLSGFIKFPTVFRDLINYRFLLRAIKRESKTSPKWAKFGLRVDWIGRIYTVYNLPPEVTLSTDIPREAWIGYVIEQAKPINEYLTSLNLQEIIVPRYTPIEGTDSYLLLYKPYFQELSWGWIISRTIFWSVIIHLQHRYQLFTNIYHFIQKFI